MNPNYRKFGYWRIKLEHFVFSKNWMAVWIAPFFVQSIIVTDLLHFLNKYLMVHSGNSHKNGTLILHFFVIIMKVHKKPKYHTLDWFFGKTIAKCVCNMNYIHKKISILGRSPKVNMILKPKVLVLYQIVLYRTIMCVLQAAKIWNSSKTPVFEQFKN